MRITTPEEFCRVLIIRNVEVRGLGKRGGLKLKHKERLMPLEINYLEQHKKEIGTVWCTLFQKGAL
jgi:hypothetical protein